MKKIYNDTISYSDNCKVTLCGKEIKGSGKWSFCNISNTDMKKYNDEFFKDIKSKGTVSFTGTFKSTGQETSESLQKAMGEYFESDYGLCEYDYIEDEIGLIIEDELFCYIDVGFKFDTPEKCYFLCLSEIKEGTLYELT